MQSRNLWNLWEPFFRKKFTQVFWGARTQVPFSLDILKASWVESFCSYKTSETIHNVECFFVRTSIWKFHKNATRKLWRKKRRRILLRRREAKITHEQHSEIVWWKKAGLIIPQKVSPEIKKKKVGSFTARQDFCPTIRKTLMGKFWRIEVVFALFFEECLLTERRTALCQSRHTMDIQHTTYTHSHESQKISQLVLFSWENEILLYKKV